MSITGTQCRIARALLGRDIADVSTISGIDDMAVIAAFERGESIPDDLIDDLQQAFEARDVVFCDGEGATLGDFEISRRLRDLDRDGLKPHISLVLRVNGEEHHLAWAIIPWSSKDQWHIGNDGICLLLKKWASVIEAGNEYGGRGNVILTESDIKEASFVFVLTD